MNVRSIGALSAQLRPWRIVVALVATTLAGCAAGTDTADGEIRAWSGVIEERDGVVYVHNPSGGLWQDRDPAPVRFELEQVFGVDTEPADEIIGDTDPHGVAVDGEGNVYVYDEGAGQLIAFAADGSVRWRTGRKGQGPGELDHPRGIAWDGDSSIWVANASLQRLDVWSTGGEFLATHSLADRGLPTGMLLGFLDPTTFAVEDGSPQALAGGELGIVDVAAWETLAQVDIDVATTDLSLNRWVVSMAVTDGVVAVGDVDSYELHFFDRKGALIRVISRDFDRMVGQVASGNTPVMYSFLEPAVRLPTGHWLTVSLWVDVEDADVDLTRRLAEGTLSDRPFRASVDVFDPEGRFLYAHGSDGPVPLIGQLQLVGPDGKLYTTASDPYPQVRRYRVDIDAS